MVIWQWFWHRRQVLRVVSTAKPSRASIVARDEVPSPVSCMRAVRAAPYAPMRPAMSGRTTSRPVSSSKARSTESLRKVPPWTTTRSPKSEGSLSLMTL